MDNIRKRRFDDEIKTVKYAAIFGAIVSLISFSLIFLIPYLPQRISPSNSYILGAICLGGTLSVVCYNYLTVKSRWIETRGDIAFGLALIILVPNSVTSNILQVSIVILLYFFLRIIYISIRYAINNIKDKTNSDT
jgi:hypothetical protein